jgi:hypothetical protein
MPLPLLTKAVFACVVLSLAPSVSAQVLLTEFMADPTGTDIDREWMEIFNAGTLSIDLGGYAIGDGLDPLGTGTGEGMGLFPAGTIIDPGEVFVIAANANGFQAFYGFLPNFEFFNSTSGLGNNAGVPDLLQKESWGNANGSLAIANGGDDVGILTPDSTSGTFTVVDGANHGTFQTFFSGGATLGANQSYERVPANADTNTASDWIVHTTGTATPGVVSIPEPSALSLAFLSCGALSFLRRRRTAWRSAR